MMDWVFVVWFLMQDGTIPKPEVRGPFTSFAHCDTIREEFRQAPIQPAGSVGYILTSCRTQAAVAKESTKKP